MAVEIEFRGVALFVTKSGTLDRVLLPNASPGVVPREGSKGLHADGTSARAHHAGILITKKNGVLVRRIEPLLGTATFAEAAGAACDTTAVDHLLPFDQLVNTGAPNDMELLSDGDAEYATRVAATVFLRGSALASSKWSKMKFKTEKRSSPGNPHEDAPTWQLSWKPSKDVVLTLARADGSSEDIALDPAHTVYVYNFDGANPEAAELNDEESCTASAQIDDIDFKWLFQVVRPKQGTLAQWIAAGTGHLPSPKSQCPSLKGQSLSDGPMTEGAMEAAAPTNPTPDVSTCFPGGWSA